MKATISPESRTPNSHPAEPLACHPERSEGPALLRNSEFGIRNSENPTPHSPLPIPEPRVANPESRTPSPELFELAPEEIEVCLRLRGAAGRHELLHYLRPPAFEDWREYERNLRSTVESVERDGEEALRFESSALEAAAALYDRLFRRARGYRDSGSGIRNSEFGNQQSEHNNPLPNPESRVPSPDRIPLHHKELVVRGLSDVAPATPNRIEAEVGEIGEAVPFALDAETIEVRLEATRAGAKHANLVHVFRPPSASDRVAHSRVLSQALYVRGPARDAALKSLLPSRLPGLVALYDKLILEARGYAVAGRPLADRAAIIRHMDPLHKKVAVQLLFEE